MGVYRMTIAGRNKPVLLRAKNKTDAVEALVEGKSLTAEEVEEALVAGDKLWTPGDPLPEDDKPEEPAAPEGSEEPPANDESEQ